MKSPIHESELPEEAKNALSGAYVYGLSWDGNCLSRGQLTQKALWQMRKLSRKYKEKRNKKLLVAKSPAIGGFELMMQMAGNPIAIQQNTPMVLQAWSDYFTYTKQFSYIKNQMYQTGVHLVLIGWYLENGSMRIRPTITVHPGMLSEGELQKIANAFMKQEAVDHPDKLPKRFSITKVKNDSIEDIQQET